MRWKSMWISYFNPLPRKEGDCYDCTACRYEKISIHSLVKRETLVFMPEMPPEMDFNPLPRKEGDNFKDWISFFLLHISIHSLVKRET